MTAGSDAIGDPGHNGDPGRDGGPSRRGVLLGVGLAGLGGALAGCSTGAVPYGANEAGVVDADGPAASAAINPGAMPSSRATPGAGRSRQASPATDKPKQATKVAGTVLGAASEIPVGGGKIFRTERIVVTQPVRGRYQGFSAVCTHVGCILTEVANGTIDCPCHGSEFAITSGAVVSGPAPSPLPRKQVKIVEGKVVLV